MTDFDPAVVAGVLAHMNGDHADDNLLIARAFGDRSAVRARMVGVDGHAGHWVYSTGADDVTAAAVQADPNAEGDLVWPGERALRVMWSAPISARPEIRREIVVLYDRACAALGVEPREHD
ncbi:MAG: DUF2470 domain-containing protein [Microcella pacifica]|uniref:DUF2470 domain-containing protein n=1 Tax=Microcella pacifica TaxID=2591847 RepID=UPI000C46F399|nr:hypothetical protein [Leifsonia sp.]